MTEVHPPAEAVPVPLEPTTETSPAPPPPLDLDKPILTLSRNIAVRVQRHSDAEEASRLGDNRKIGQNMRKSWPDPYTVDKAHDWIARCRDEGEWASTLAGCPDDERKKLSAQEQKVPRSWAITQDDKLIGGIGIQTAGDMLERSLSVGYWLGEPYWNQGIVSEVVAAFIAWIWSTFPYIVRIGAGHYGWNPNSGKVLKKCGFQYEATMKANIARFGKVTDLVVYGLVREGTEVTNTMPY